MARRLQSGLLALLSLALVPASTCNYTFSSCPPLGLTPSCGGPFASRVPREVEQGYLGIVDALLSGRSADPRADRRHGLYVAFLALAEGLRLVDCLAAHAPPCVEEGAFESSLGELCSYVEEKLLYLEEEGIATPDVIGGLRAAHGCWQSDLGGSREVALWSLGVLLIHVSAGCDVDLVSSWASARSPFPRRAPLAPPSAPPLRYPAELAPPGVCGVGEHGGGGGGEEAGLVPGDEPRRPWRDVSGHFAPYLAADAALRRLKRRGVGLSRFAVNLGAANGACGWGSLYDPVNCLLEDRSSNVTALVFEGRAELFPELWRRFGLRKDVHLRLGWTTPRMAVRDILAVSPVGGDMDLLKVDVDNCDSCFVDAVLQAGIRPKIIHVEITAFLPPGLAAQMPFSRRDRETRMCGSLGEFLRVAPGYRLLHVEYVNAVLVRQDIYPHLAGETSLTDEEKWRLGYFCHPLRTLSDWGFDALYRRQGVDVSVFADPRIPLEERRELALQLHPDQAQRREYTVRLL